LFAPLWVFFYTPQERFPLTLLAKVMGTALVYVFRPEGRASPMQRVASVMNPEEVDELVNDRLPGMPFLGLLTGAVLSLALWGAVAIIAWTL
jgi:hypothetical protein